jgi:type I restriction enzyme M protein
MLDQETKRRIDTARDILVGKLPNPQSQVEQITIAMIYKFMDDMDKEAMEFGGEATFFTGDYEKYSWTKIFDPKLGGYEMLALYGEAIVKLNQNPNIPQLFRDIFKNAYLPYRDPETLKMFLKVINEFHYDHSEKLGDAFEYLLSVLGSQGDAGQFRTPRHIIDFMVAIMQPKKDESICDPACGTAGFLISSYRHILNENTKKDKGDLLTPDERKKLINNFVGYDISSEMVRLSLVNMYLHGFTTPKIYEYDTLTSTDRWGDTFDIIMANPPFMTPKGGIRPHKKFTMKANRSEVLFVDYIMEHINPTTGRAAVIVPEGIIFQSATAYKALRKLLVDKNFLYGVVSLPAGIFQPYSGVKTSILLLDKTLAKKTDKILFVKIENDGYSLGAQRKELATSDLPDATNFIKQYITAIRNNDFSLIDFEHLPLNSIAVEKSRIAENGDYNLSFDRYNIQEIVNYKFDLIELGDICDIKTGKRDVNYSTPDGQFPFFTCAAGQFKSPDYSFDDEAILLPGNGANVGMVFYYKGKFEAYQRTYVLSNFSNNVIPKYVYHVLNETWKSYILNKQFGSATNYIVLGSLLSFKIPLPPISIQQEIVSKIEQYEKIIAGAKQVVENYKPQIDIKPEWEMVELGSVCEFEYGKALKEENRINGDYPVFGSNGIVGYHNDYIVEAPFIIIGRKGSAGTVHYSFKNGFPIDTTFFVKLKNENIIKQIFLYYLLLQMDLKNVNVQAGVPGLNRNDAYKLKIPLPPVSEQDAIVAQIEKEQQIVNANKELIKIYEQKIKDEINKLWEE